jgi:cytochrome c
MGIVRIYDLATGQFLSDCRAHSSAIMCIKFSPDGKQIVSTGKDGLVAIWNVFM